MRKIKLILILLFTALGASYNPAYSDGSDWPYGNNNYKEPPPVLKFANKSALKYRKILTVGQVEILEFAQPVSLAHYGVGDESLNYIELDKLEPDANGFRKFIIKAKKPGYGEMTFKSGDDLIKLELIVQNDYKLLEQQLNELFGLKNPKPEEKITVVPATHVGAVSSESNAGAHIYLKGMVESPKEALLAISFAANAVGDYGVKIFSNPGGQLRLKDLDSAYAQSSGGSGGGSSGGSNGGNNNGGGFVEFYESTNKLIDTNNLHRDLVLASENDMVVSYIKVREPSRYAVKVRFLEMDARYVDDFASNISVTGVGNDFNGAFGSTDLIPPTISVASNITSQRLVDFFAEQGVLKLTDQIVGGNLASGAAKLFDDTRVNFSINDLLDEGVLRVVNEFSLITHSGERISLGKGIRFPIPTINNNIGGSNISVEYIPIGFKGELKVTGLDSGLVDVQLASRLTSVETGGSSVIQGFVIPVFREEFVNSGAFLKDGQEMILNTFLTEAENYTTSTSPLGRIIPFLGKAKRKDRSKNLLFVALEVNKLEKTSEQVLSNSKFQMPHVDYSKNKDIYSDLNRDLRKKKVTDTIDISSLNNSPTKEETSDDEEFEADPLALDGLELMPGVEL